MFLVDNSCQNEEPPFTRKISICGGLLFFSHSQIVCPATAVDEAYPDFLNLMGASAPGASRNAGRICRAVKIDCSPHDTGELDL